MVDKNEMLIMENLNPKGYVVWNRRLHFTDEHIRLVYNTLGHFHAISFAMRDQQPEIIANHTKHWGNMLKKFSETCDFMGLLTTKLKRVEAALEAADQVEAAKKVVKFYNGIEEFFEEVYGMVDQYAAILHGDNWINNMLFKSGVSRRTKHLLICKQSREVNAIYLFSGSKESHKTNRHSLNRLSDLKAGHPSNGPLLLLLRGRYQVHDGQHRRIPSRLP